MTALVGQNGWDLERFGTEATILRARRVTTSVASTGGLLLSCAGADRRLRLTLPGAIAATSGGSGAGRLLMRAGGAASTARVTVQGGVLTLTDQRMIDMVLLELRASAGASHTLSLLLDLGSSSIMLGRSMAFHLSFASTAGDAPAFRDAAEACGRDTTESTPATPR
ncbi:hypothetical protein MKK70_29370 [Methylobacterium sp. E-041]|uniref:hypothetical protein n=1 Tax=Methylobacterium sp. E-041 TaxID=2836573 RepID=UPI001FBA2E59|nr:hypothetical protein [Methylobacterium sp. E-041]MCJ2109404.1 hypothetical protein [Methylobacterium sp. E-041]